MRRVILESPYAGPDDATRSLNVDYARAALLDSLGRGEAPLASHLLYTQVLNDDVPDQRRTGIAAGLAWAEYADATVVYIDLGLSAGMLHGINDAVKYDRRVEFRKLAGWGADK